MPENPLVRPDQDIFAEAFQLGAITRIEQFVVDPTMRVKRLDVGQFQWIGDWAFSLTTEVVTTNLACCSDFGRVVSLTTKVVTTNLARSSDFGRVVCLTTEIVTTNLARSSDF